MVAVASSCHEHLVFVQKPNRPAPRVLPPQIDEEEGEMSE